MAVSRKERSSGAPEVKKESKVINKEGLNCTDLGLNSPIRP